MTAAEPIQFEERLSTTDLAAEITQDEMQPRLYQTVRSYLNDYNQSITYNSDEYIQEYLNEQMAKKS